jgi:predicted acyl esterase
MLEGSYSGFRQYLAAPTRPPHPRALFVRQASPLSHAAVFRGGAFPLRWLGAITRHVLDDFVSPAAESPAQNKHRESLQRAVDEQASWERHLPLKDYPPLMDMLEGRFSTTRTMEPGGGSATSRATTRRSTFRSTTFLPGSTSSWGAQLDHFQGIRTRGRSPLCRRSQWLVIGPWNHGSGTAGNRRVGELGFGPRAELDLPALWLS